MVINKRKEAASTVAIQVASSGANAMSAVSRTLEICNNYGLVSKAICTDEAQPPGMKLILVQFERKEMADKLLKSCVFEKNNENSLPVQSRFLHHYTSRKSRSDNILYDNYTTPTDQILLDCLMNCTDVSEQMSKLYNLDSLREFGSRARFLVCREIEDTLSGLFPFIRGLPFGSSINGLGRHNCDLDVFLEFGAEMTSQSPKSFYFQSKKFPIEGRLRTQRTLGIFGDLLQNFSPNVSNVNRIIHARVPILKFQQDRLDLDCDISITNMTGYYMSELLYLYGQLDPRLRPLIFTIRKWAASANITSSVPGHWLTNFSLALMTIFFFQNKHILPSLENLKKMAGSSDKRKAAEIDCSFCRDAKMVEKSQNVDNLEALLNQFFEFYLNYDFELDSISVIAGSSQVKLFNSALYIVNPLECELNVSRNVSGAQVQRFKVKCAEALDILSGKHASCNTDSLWGIMELFRSQSNPPSKRKTVFHINEVLNPDKTNDKSKPNELNENSTADELEATKPVSSVKVQKSEVRKSRLDEISKRLVTSVTTFPKNNYNRIKMAESPRPKKKQPSLNVSRNGTLWKFL